MARLTSLREAAAKGYSELKKVLEIIGIMKLKGIRNIPKNHLPPVLEDSMTHLAGVEIVYQLTATEYWNTGSAVRCAEYAETPGQAYKTYWRFRREYPKCKISLTQRFSFHGGGAVPISLRRPRQLSSQ